MENLSLVSVSWYNALLGSGLIAVAIGLCYFQGFGLEKDILVGTIRMVLQLIFIGFALSYIFKIGSIWWLILILAVMALIASHTAWSRMKPAYPGAIPIMWISLGIGTFAAVGFITLVAIRDPVALSARYLIPLGSMVIGNALNGLSIGSERYRSELLSQKDRIECLLAMGATPSRATRESKRSAFAASMIPTINMMMVIGLIQIPGVMTGQVLAGVKPMDAALYQLLVMAMLVGGKVITMSLALRLGERKYFTSSFQLRTELLQA